MRFSDYLKGQMLSLCLLVACVLLSTLLLNSLGVAFLFIFFIEGIFIAAFIAERLYDFSKRSYYYNKVLKTLGGLEQKTLLSEVLEAPTFVDGEIMLDIIKQSDKYMNDRLAEMELKNREYREYIEMWVHEIKTPITSAHLIIDNEKNETTLRIEDELLKIDHFVEQSLYYARSTALEKDFRVEEVVLRDLCATAVKAYSRPIIQAGGQVELGELESSVFADTKWCVFIIGQILANSVKYHNGSLRISFSEEQHSDFIRLIIRDNGIGIPEEDMSRLFDKGFTGSNGRRYGKSTGIGLYLCNKLCLKMNMSISMESKVNEGTTTMLDFPKNSLLSFQSAE